MASTSSAYRRPGSWRAQTARLLWREAGSRSFIRSRLDRRIVAAHQAVLPFVSMVVQLQHGGLLGTRCTVSGTGSWPSRSTGVSMAARPTRRLWSVRTLRCAPLEGVMRSAGRDRRNSCMISPRALTPFKRGMAVVFNTRCSSEVTSTRRLVCARTRYPRSWHPFLAHGASRETCVTLGLRSWK